MHAADNVVVSAGRRYKEAYEQSLIDCQGASAPCMVQSHQAQVAASARTPVVARMVNSMRDLNSKHPQHQPLVSTSTSSAQGGE